MRLMTRMFLFAFGQFISNVCKKDSNQYQSCSNLSKSINLPKIHFSNFLSNHTVINKKSIAKVRSNINTKKSYKFLGKETLEPISGATNHAAEILMDKPESAFNQGRNFFLLT